MQPQERIPSPATDAALSGLRNSSQPQTQASGLGYGIAAFQAWPRKLTANHRRRARVANPNAPRATSAKVDGSGTGVSRKAIEPLGCEVSLPYPMI